MIYETLEIIKDQVENYLEEQLSEANLLVLENIAKVEDPEISTMKDKVVVSLINLEEEVSLKNHPHRSFQNGSYEYKNKPIHLNLYLLFSANRNAYTKSIIALSHIMAFFQGKKVFTQHNTILNPTITALNNLKEFKFTIDLYTPTFEQLNYVWGTLGGKSLPNVMYKVSIVTVESTNIIKKGSAITHLEGTLTPTSL